jgi:hypothetical protein
VHIGCAVGTCAAALPAARPPVGLFAAAVSPSDALHLLGDVEYAPVEVDPVHGEPDAFAAAESGE